MKWEDVGRVPIVKNDVEEFIRRRNILEELRGEQIGRE